MWMGPHTYERDYSRVNGTIHFWTKPVDYQFTNGGPIHTWRSIHTRRYRLHMEDNGQPIPNLWTESLRVTVSSTCERDIYVWMGPVLVKDPPRVNETSTCEWNEMSIYKWTLDKRLKFRRWFLNVLTRVLGRSSTITDREWDQLFFKQPGQDRLNYIIY